MSIAPQDSSKKDIIIRSQSKKNPTLVNEIEEISQDPFEVECKSHPRTNSRLPWDAVDLCCFEKISWDRMVKILVRYWLRIRIMCVYV